MTKDFYPKLIGTALAFSILFFGTYHHNFELADHIRVVTILILVIGFTIITLKANKLSQIALSISLVLWVILLMNPTEITDQLAFLEQEAALKELALLVQSDKEYQKMSIYTNLNDQNSQAAYDLFAFQLPQPIDQLKTAKKLEHLKTLLTTTNTIGFQLGHGCITFYSFNKKTLRYYYNNVPPYQGDRKIKTNWYWVKQPHQETVW